MDGVGRVGDGAIGARGIAPEADDAGGGRRRKRDSLFLTGQLALADEAGTREVRVRNLSEGGLMIELDRAVAPGTTVTLVVRGLGEITGHVAWCTQGRLGIALDRRIDPRRARKPVGTGPTTPEYAKPLIAPTTPRR